MKDNIHETNTSKDVSIKELEFKNLEKDILYKIFKFIKESPPLFLPTGSVRAILALGSLSISGIMMIQGLNVPEWLYSSIVMVLGFYFGERNGKTK